MIQEYDNFIQKKRHSSSNFGIEPLWIPDNMFDFQQYVADWEIRRGRAAGFLDTGSGKTLIELVTAANYLRYTNKPVLIATPLAVAFQFLKEAEKFGIDDVEYSRDGKYKKKIVVCNYERIHYFDPSDFDCVILDECFAPDTKIKVLTENGLQEKHIKDCNSGEKVLNCTGFDTITSVKRKKVDYAIKIGFNGKEIICSPRHPFFTQRGWVAAKEITENDFIVSSDAAMRILRGGISDNKIMGKREKVLRDILLGEMANETAGNIGSGSQRFSSRKARSSKIEMVQNAGSRKGTAKNKDLKSNEQPGNAPQVFGGVESDGAQTFSAWGKWSGDDIASAIDEGCSVRQLDSGICYITGKASAGLSDKLQSRFGELRKKNCDRGGWKLSPQQKAVRQEEGRKTGFFGVESFEVLEQADSRLDNYRDESGALYFIDLSIERHPSFTINECLVHNSSILKNDMGKTRLIMTAFLKKVKYRYLYTATPSPNDYIELGTSSEALGYLGYTDMLTRFFTNNEDTVSPQGIGVEWRLKGHAEEAFFQWVASWSLSMRKPSDLGFDDSRFILPDLVVNDHAVENKAPLVVGGQYQMFNIVAKTRSEISAEQRATIEQRCEKAVELARKHEYTVYWTNLNPEADLVSFLDKDSVQIKGGMKIEQKEEILLAFLNGEIKKLVTKPKITCFGLNWQHCNHTVIFPGFSHEQYYQMIRRFYRFGQTRPVNVDRVYSDGQIRIIQALEVKAKKADNLFSKLNENLNKGFEIKSKGFDKNIILPNF